jgi:hypothetical protein
VLIVISDGIADSAREDPDRWMDPSAAASAGTTRRPPPNKFDKVAGEGASDDRTVLVIRGLTAGGAQKGWGAQKPISRRKGRSRPASAGLPVHHAISGPRAKRHAVRAAGVNVQCAGDAAQGEHAGKVKRV